MLKRMFIFLISAILLLSTVGACRQNPPATQSPEKSQVNITFEPTNTPIITVISSPKPKPTDRVEVPALYKDYLISNKLISQDEPLVIFEKADFDLDGVQEILVASANINDSDPSRNFYHHGYILREKNGTIDHVKRDLRESIFSINDIKIISLKGETQKLIYLGQTNTVNLQGFKILALNKDDTLKVICESISYTSAGNDSLKDFDNDGLMDGYIQNRWSNDSIYFKINRIFEYKNGVFVETSSTIGMPVYPTNTTEVIFQYFSLRALELVNCPDSNKRLTELCTFSKAGEIKISGYDWVKALATTNLFFDIDSGKVNIIKFQTTEGTDTADTVISYTSENKKLDFKYNIHLTKVNDRWVIDNII